LKFPYIFVDEFQDTNPLQTQIIKKIANSGSIVGVIGDSEQSIYKFQGAQRQDFLDFTLPNLEIYQIKGNHRSTKAIINLLDNLRNDKIAQTSIRGIEGVLPTVYTENRAQVIQKLQNLHPDLVILSRKNETVGQIKNSNNKELGDLWTISRNLDSNFDRQRLLYNAIYSAEMCLLGYYKDASRIASKIFYKFSNGVKINDTKKKELAISIIDYLISHKNNNLNKTILEFHNALYEYLSLNYQVTVGAKISKGAFKDFAHEKTYADLVQSLRIKDDTSKIKTIHKAKGAEFNNVLVAFDSSDELKYILEPQKYQIDDDSRIYYVAFSRARENLYLHINEPISKEIMNKLMSIGINNGILTK
jgi:DNA helicase-2/ATP-dependent DNA helicase PcrA